MTGSPLSDFEHHNQRGIDWRRFISSRILEIRASDRWMLPVIDIGSGVSSLVTPVFDGATTFDVDAACSPNLVGDVVHVVPGGEGVWGTAFAIELLEHVVDPSAAVSNIARSLLDDGRLYASVPFSCVGFHGEDMFRFTTLGINTILSGLFDEIIVEEYWSPLNPNRDVDALSYLPDGLFVSAVRKRGCRTAPSS